MAYRIGTEQRGGGTVYQLFDDDNGASASVLPSYGFNLFDLRLPAGGDVRPLVAAAEDWADNPRSPGGNGTPVLFPFPNRIKDARYSFQGKDYQIPANHGANAIHGFAIKAPWEVVEHTTGENGARLTGRYRISQQTPEVLSSWPTDGVLEITYTLAGAASRSTRLSPTRPTRRSPTASGFTPTTGSRSSPDGNPDQTTVVLPASETWVLEDFIPTGERRPVDDRLDFRKGQSMAGLKLDDVLTGLEGDPRVCRLIDKALGSEFRIVFGTEFREIVAYTPPGPGGVIAVEPYTMTTNAINLQARGVDAGLRVLQHGERNELRIVMETRDSIGS